MFNIDLTFGECNGYVVAALRGELDLADAAAVLLALRAAAKRKPWIIVDLAALEFIDASGVAALSSSRWFARNAGGDLLLAAPQRQVKRVLAIIWEAGGTGVAASVAAAAASARVPPGRWSLRSSGSALGCPSSAINAPAPERHALTGTWIHRGRWGPCYRLRQTEDNRITVRCGPRRRGW
jgi:anti-sigma B factor antagonist